MDRLKAESVSLQRGRARLSVLTFLSGILSGSREIFIWEKSGLGKHRGFDQKRDLEKSQPVNFLCLLFMSSVAQTNRSSCNCWDFTKNVDLPGQ